MLEVNDLLKRGFKTYYNWIYKFYDVDNSHYGILINDDQVYISNNCNNFYITLTDNKEFTNDLYYILQFIR